MTQKLSWVFAAFLLGIAAHSIQPFTPVPLEWWWMAFGCSALFCWIVRSYFWPLLCSMLIAAFLLGAWRFDISLPREPVVAERAEYFGKVTAVDDHAKRSTIIVDVERGNILLQTNKSSELIEGARVTFACTVRAPATSEKDVQRRRMLARKGIWMECPGVTVVTIQAAPSAWDVVSHLAHARHALTARIRRIFPPDEAELVAGMLYGDQDLADLLQEDIRRAGLMHLVAVSGSNVTIVVVVIAALALGLGCTRRQSFFLTTGMLVAFVIFVGASASVLRAAFMGWFLLLARELGRKGWADRVLLVTAVVLLSVNPWMLCFDAGFALSFLAMWGLLTWASECEQRFTFLPETLGIRASIATTLGATLMTSPYLAYMFGRMTLAGLVTNVLALPLVPWIMLWGAIGVVFPLFSLPALGLVRLIMYIAQLSRWVPWLDLHIEGMDLGVCIACYVLIWRWWILFSQKGRVDRDVAHAPVSSSRDGAYK